MRIEQGLKLDYSNVLLRPKRSTLGSRKDVGLTKRYKFRNYVPTEMSTPNTVLFGEVRGKRMPVQVSRLPHVPARFKR